MSERQRQGPRYSPNTAAPIEGDEMRELTTYELETELAEQLPARELMGSCGQPSCYHPCPCPPPCQPPCLSLNVCISVSV